MDCITVYIKITQNTTSSDFMEPSWFHFHPSFPPSPAMGKATYFISSLGKLRPRRWRPCLSVDRLMNEGYNLAHPLLCWVQPLHTSLYLLSNWCLIFMQFTKELPIPSLNCPPIYTSRIYLLISFGCLNSTLDCKNFPKSLGFSLWLCFLIFIWLSHDEIAKRVAVIFFSQVKSVCTDTKKLGSLGFLESHT